MSDLPVQGVLQQHNARNISGEHLEVLGKSAAAKWADGQYRTLTESVVGVVKHAHLSPEQVRRVVEFANTAAFLDDFKKEGSPHRFVDFPGGPANPSEVLKDLNDGGGGTISDDGLGDYSQPPGGEKQASVDEDAALRELFKAAEAPVVYAEPLEPLVSLREKLAGAIDHLNGEVSALEIEYADCADQMYRTVKQAALDGTNLGDVLQAWESISPSPDHIKVAFSLMTPRFLREGVFHTLEDMTKSVDVKTASARLVNEEHPVMQKFAGFCIELSKLAIAREARAEVRRNLSEVDQALKTANAGGMVGDVFRGAGRMGEAVKASPFAQKALGETGASLLGTGVKAAPYLGAAALLNEANMHINNSPSIPARGARGLKKFVLQNIPGTQENLMHQWEIQNGQ